MADHLPSGFFLDRPHAPALQVPEAGEHAHSAGGLLSAERLIAEVPHHFGIGHRRVISVEILIAEGAQYQSLRLDPGRAMDGGMRGWGSHPRSLTSCRARDRRSAC